MQPPATRGDNLEQLPPAMAPPMTVNPQPKDDDKRKDDQDTKYWSATVSKVTNYVEPIMPLTFNEANLAIHTGTSVLCVNEAAANDLVPLSLYPGRIRENHSHGREGYLPHYHMDRKSHVHIWFYE